MSISPAPSRVDASREHEARAIPRWLLAAGGLYLAAYAAWLVFGWGGPERKHWIGGLAYLPVAAAVAVQCRAAARRCADTPPIARGWLLIGGAIIAYALGTELQVVYEQTGGMPSVSAADVGYLAFYPLFLAGVLQLRRGRAATRTARAALDAVIFGFGGAVTIWYLALGPTANDTHGTGVAEAMVTFAYPTGDLVLVAALTLLLMDVHAVHLRRPIALLAAGVLLYVIGDIWWTQISDYSGGDTLDVFWIAAALCFGLAAAAQRRVESVRLLDAPTEPVGRAPHVELLPYGAALVVLALLIVSQTDDAFYPGLSLTLAAVLTAVLVLLRQGLVQRDLAGALTELEAAHDELAALATTDPLTALPNHRALVAAIDKELERSRRFERPCGLVFFDIDHFKTLNDTHGHGAGDDVLRELAALVRESLRTMDTVGRWGGEEFVIVLPESDATEALGAAERLRAAVARHLFSPGHGTHLTISLGTATYPSDGATRGELLAAADRAMYTAKRLGRNQTFAAANPAVMAFPGDAPWHEPDDGALLGAVDALALLVDARDNGTANHSSSVASLAERLALTLGCTIADARRIHMAAKLHDIGKVAVADAILRKPGRLTAEEWELMHRHPDIGADVVGRIGQLAELAPIIRAHHEHYDGGGYPRGLAGDAIPLAARIVGVADAFDAMVTDRPYRPRMDLERARAELRRCAGTQFDPDVVAALEQILEHEAAASGGAYAA